MKRDAAGPHLRPRGNWDLIGVEKTNKMNADVAKFK
jgi:hypothetical protein